jgi:cation:H+ antiporter
MIAINIISYILSFLAIWFGAGLIVKSIESIARRLKMSPFAISFLILGVMTSIPEAAVGINSIVNNDPEIFVGNLLGGIAVIFLLVIPILAILGKGIKLDHSLDKDNLVGLLLVIVGPSLIVIDHGVTKFEGVILILCYLISLYSILRKHGFWEKKEVEELHKRTISFVELAKVVAGVIIVFVSSQFIVDKTLLFSEMLKINPYYLSILVLSLGTNLPELSIAIRAVTAGKKDIAFGNYLGSAAANTLLFGVFTIMNNGEVFTFNSFLITFLFIASGLVMFYFFSQTKRDISRKEGYILFSLYILFVIYQIISGLRS